MNAVGSNSANSVDVIIVGASVRAAAFSALRAGLRPYCLDQFADSDTRAQTQTLRVDPYPDGLFPVLDSLPRMPVIYTGGLENRPDILDRIAFRHELWGNSGDIVRKSRDPVALAEAARLSRIGFPEWRNADDPPPADGSWILRPLASAGGRGIVLWTPDQARSSTLSEPHLFQKVIHGQPFSAVFIAQSGVGDVRFVGMTRQLIGEEACNALPYQWCGNIGPVALPVSVENVVRRFGNVLKWKLGLLGLYGVDLILASDGTPHVTEVNPRYPASLELLEHATGQPLLADHCRCFTTEPLPETSWKRAHPGEFMGKAVYYAPDDLVVNGLPVDPESVPSEEFPVYADLPGMGQRIRAGEPVCTVFAESYSSDHTLEILNQELKGLGTQLSPVS